MMYDENKPEETKDKEGVLLAASSDTSLLFDSVSVSVDATQCKLILTVGGNVFSASMTKETARTLLAQLQERLD